MGRELSLKVVEVDALTEQDEARLVALVARTFPGEPSLAGKWHHDTRPSFVVLAESAHELVGMRIVVERSCAGGRIAGFGIGVDPAWQRQGVGAALTKRALEEVAARGFELALAFLFSANAEPLLRAHGFAPLNARVSYIDRKSGAYVVEASAAWARDVTRAGAVAAIERAGSLDLGLGTW